MQPGFVRRHGMLATLTQDRAHYSEEGRRPSPALREGEGALAKGVERIEQKTPKLESNGKFIRKRATLRRQHVVPSQSEREGARETGWSARGRRPVKAASGTENPSGAHVSLFTSFFSS